ncbi:hypothetical protein AB0J83_03205 [Actinoplanes sp. NPDC049596]|uniref:hypothetical protein n=1 Tax=unclassified Actinoplanes TaxID=2626549 RepID=UPI00341CFB94
MPRFSPAGQQPVTKPIDHAPLQKPPATESHPLPAIRGLSLQRTIIDGGLLNDVLPWPAGTIVTITTAGNADA